MSAEEKKSPPRRFDAVIVGGGPAGLAAAYTLASAGVEVACIERGDWPGSKNMMGGLIFSHPTSEIVPDFWKSAPLERHITKRDFWLTASDSALKASFESADFAREPYNAFSVFRSHFDKWLAGEARKKGAYIITETLVEDLLWDSGFVTGIVTGREEGELKADVVIIAEGANTFLSRKAGLYNSRPQGTFALGVKEVLALPQEKIEDRFGLDEGAGAAIEIVGEITGGLPGTGFIYTNKNTISIGVGVMLKEMVEANDEAYSILKKFKAQPQVKRLIDGASPLEYAAHLIPEGGYNEMPRLYGDGVLVAGDAACMVNAVYTEGANLALLSGKMAAETVLICRGLGRFDADALSIYQDFLERSLILKDLKKYKDVTPFISSRPQFFTVYPELLAAMIREFFTVDSLSKVEKHTLIKRLFRSQIPSRQLLKELYQAWRTLS